MPGNEASQRRTKQQIRQMDYWDVVPGSIVVEPGYCCPPNSPCRPSESPPCESVMCHSPPIASPASPPSPSSLPSTPPLAAFDSLEPPHPESWTANKRRSPSQRRRSYPPRGPSMSPSMSPSMPINLLDQPIRSRESATSPSLFQTRREAFLALQRRSQPNSRSQSHHITSPINSRSQSSLGRPAKSQISGFIRSQEELYGPMIFMGAPQHIPSLPSERPRPRPKTAMGARPGRLSKAHQQAQKGYLFFATDNRNWALGPLKCKVKTTTPTDPSKHS